VRRPTAPTMRASPRSHEGVTPRATPRSAAGSPSDSVDVAVYGFVGYSEAKYKKIGLTLVVRSYFANSASFRKRTVGSLAKFCRSQPRCPAPKMTSTRSYLSWTDE
jgi:hypothetical protein